MALREYFLLREPLTPLLPDALRGHVGDLGEIKALARFGYAEKDELCFCDREPSSEFCSIYDQATVLCTPEVRSILADRIPRARLVSVEDPRSLYIDIARRLLDHDALEVTSYVERPFGISSASSIGPNTVIHPEARIDAGVRIGANCTIHRGVWVKGGAFIEDGSVIGARGINAYLARDGRVLDFPHLAGVLIGERTHVGANSVLVQGVLTSTVIGSDTVVGNLCNIGHGVEIGTGVWMSVGCKIGGHTMLGEGVTIGMGVLIRDNLRIGSGAQLGMGSVVVKDMVERGSVFGNPARPVPPLSAGPKR